MAMESITQAGLHIPAPELLRCLRILNQLIHTTPTVRPVEQFLPQPPDQLQVLHA